MKLLGENTEALQGLQDCEIARREVSVVGRTAFMVAAERALEAEREVGRNEKRL